MKAAILGLLLTLFAPLASAHSGHGGSLVFAGGLIRAQTSWVQGPDVKGGESQMQLQWRDGVTNNLVEPGLPFSVTLWMPSMNHGSAPTRIRPMLNHRGEKGVGTYLVSNMHFLMPGDWDIRISLKLPGGGEETKVWSILLPPDGHHGPHH